jgi:hypothetical protein
MFIYMCYSDDQMNKSETDGTEMRHKLMRIGKIGNVAEMSQNLEEETEVYRNKDQLEKGRHEWLKDRRERD